MHRLLLLIFSLTVPSIAFGDEYQPLILATLFPDGAAGSDLGSYLNALFNVAVLMGSILAVLIIASAGLQYMTTDAITKKQSSLERIQKAVLGLLMLLGSYLLFEQINPDILKFKYPGADTSALHISIG